VQGNDILLIADEVMTGLGRTGRTWGHQLFPIRADVIVGGKGLGGGYVPMGAVANARATWPTLLRDAGFMFFTFTGTDAMCAGAAAVLHILEREAPCRALRSDGRAPPPPVARRARRPPARRGGARARPLRRIELVRDRDTVAQFPAAARVATVVVGQALQRDVWVYPPAPDRCGTP
jgi:adenosylmethionine-8-amino-7-oxononanoate aminotransferase